MVATADEAESERVLAAAGVSGEKLAMVSEPDGWVAITWNGNASPGCRWPVDRLDQCVTVFLAMLRNRPIP